jgi:hypothetical protein
MNRHVKKQQAFVTAALRRSANRAPLAKAQAATRAVGSDAERTLRARQASAGKVFGGLPAADPGMTSYGRLLRHRAIVEYADPIRTEPVDHRGRGATRRSA